MFVYLLMSAGVLGGFAAGFRLGETETTDDPSAKAQEGPSQLGPCQSSETIFNTDRRRDLKRLKQHQTDMHYRGHYGDLESGVQFTWKHDVFLSSTPMTYIRVPGCSFLEDLDMFPLFFRKYRDGSLFYVGWDPRSARVMTSKLRKELRCGDRPHVNDPALRQRTYMCTALMMDPASPRDYDYLLFTQIQDDEPLMLGMAVWDPVPIQKMFRDTA